MEKLFQTYDNAAVLSKYDFLNQQNRNPDLSIYGGRELIITSYSVYDLSGRIINVFKKIIYSILTAIGIVQKDPNKIKEMRIAINQHHLDHIKKHSTEELAQLDESRTNLSQQVTQIQNEFILLQSNLTEARYLIANKTETENILHRLQREVRSLESARDSIPNLEARAQQLNTSISLARSTLDQIRADTSQEDYKTQVSEQEYIIATLRNENARLQGEIDNMGSLSYYPCPDPSAH